MAYSSVLSFLLSTHSVDCAVPLNRVNSDLFLQFSALLCHFDKSVHRTFFRYIMISSNSTLPIMKRNRNGISLFLNGKLLFWKWKITGPTIAVDNAWDSVLMSGVNKCGCNQVCFSPMKLDIISGIVG